MILNNMRFSSLMTSMKVSAFKCFSLQPTCSLLLLNCPQCGRETWEQEIAENTNLPVQEFWMLCVYTLICPKACVPLFY